MMMSLPTAALRDYTSALVRANFPDGLTLPDISDRQQSTALERLEFCFSRIKTKYYRAPNDASQTYFDHMHGDHFAAYLYFLGNTIWKETSDPILPIRLFYLNKGMHGIDLFYSVAMPPVFLLVHPLGTVVGNAKFGNFLAIYQNVTIGANLDGRYPTFGDGVIVFSKASVIGDCRVGDNVAFGANSLAIDCTVASDSVFVGQFPSHRVKRQNRNLFDRLFGR